MDCVIYSSDKKYGSYLYLEKVDDFSRVPEPLLNMLGRLEFVMELALDEHRKLAQADVMTVMADLAGVGYYLQVPPKDYELKPLV